MAASEGDGTHGLPQSYTFRKEGNGLPLDAKVWSVSKKIQHPTAADGKQKWFLQETGEKYRNIQSFRDRGSCFC